MNIEIELDTPNGPRVNYTAEHDEQAVLDALPRDWGVDFSNQIKTSLVTEGEGGEMIPVYRAPLVRKTRPSGAL